MTLKKSLLASLLAVSTLVACGGTKAGAPESTRPDDTKKPTDKPETRVTEDHPLGDDLDPIIAKALADYKVPGLALGVIHNDKDVLMRGYGTANSFSKQPVTPATLFAIGSITKSFTATATALLVEEGKLSFDSPIKSLLGTFELGTPEATAQVTLRHALSHQSGLPRHDLVWYNNEISRRQIFDNLRYLDLSAKPGEKFQYNNLMYLVAGLATASRAGRSWEDLVQQRLLTPLKMQATITTPLSLPRQPDVAHPHAFDPASKHVYPIPVRNTVNIAPAGSIHSNVLDMAAWLRLHLGQAQGLALQPETLAELHRTQVAIAPAHPEIPEVTELGYALGWMRFRFRGLEVLAHSGGIDGFISYALIVPEKGFGIVALQNATHANVVELLTYEILDRLAANQHTGWIARFDVKLRESMKPPVEHPAPTLNPGRDWTAYKGNFVHPAYGLVRVQPQAGAKRLAVQLNQNLVSLVPVEGDIFVQTGKDPSKVGNRVAFEFDVAGAIKAVVMSLEPLAGPIRFEFKNLAVEEGNEETNPGPGPLHLSPFQSPGPLSSIDGISAIDWSALPE